MVRATTGDEGQVLPFLPKQRKPRSDARPGQAGGTVLLFTGVRYQRAGDGTILSGETGRNVPDRRVGG